MNSYLPLAGRVALVTGASKGIGAATARLFAREGASVVVTGRRPAPIEAVAAEIPADTPEPAARDVARIALAELFEGTPHRPTIDVALPTDGAGRVLEFTVRPRGFYGVRLEEVTLGARLAHGGT